MLCGIDTRKDFSGQQVTVSDDRAVCTHAAECVRGLPQVFDTAARPWIQPDGAAPQTVIEVVARCRSGALRIEARATD
jgi:uncharacterized Fe-S cluster protein YjdI